MTYSLNFFTLIGFTAIGTTAIYWLARQRNLSNTFLRFWLLGLLIVGGMAFELLAFKVSTPPYKFSDFLIAYYPAGQAVVHNDHAALRELTSKGVSGFVNMPVVAYLFAPFGLFGERTAIVLFTLVCLGFAVASWFLLVRMLRLELRERWLLAFLFATSGPMVNVVKLGNTSHVILFFLVTAFMLLRSGRSGASGVLLGLAAVIKLPLILFGLFFLFRRDWRGVLSFVGTGAVVILLSLILFGWSDNLHWFQALVVAFSHFWLPSFNVQSVPGFILRLDPSARLNEWVPQLPSAGQKITAQIVTGLMFLIAAAACFRLPSQVDAQSKAEADERRDMQYLLMICLCLVTSPLTWSHYYVWLLIPISFFLTGKLPFASLKPVRIVGWVAIALVMPLVAWPWSISNPVLMVVYRAVVMSHLLFGGLLWFGLIAWGLSRSSGLLALLPHREVSGHLGSPAVLDSRMEKPN